MTKADLLALQAQIAELSKRGIADAQTIAILQANITLAMARVDSSIGLAKERVAEIVADGRAAIVKLTEMELDAKTTAHRNTSLQTALLALLDYLDKVEPVPKDKQGSA